MPASVPSVAEAFTFSTTEIQFQMGRLKNPFAASGATKAWTPIVTLQHASSWVFGDVFFFIDFLDDKHRDGFNDEDAYGELYLYFSSAKLLGMKYGGALKDVGIVAGVNAGADPDYRGYLPGVYLDWNVPGFAFFRTQFTALIDDSKKNGGNGSQKDGWQADASFAAPFELAGQYFSFEGHIEYTENSRNKTYNSKMKDWILAQPQLRWDAGYALTGKKDVFFLGTEYQFWMNKLGTNVDESRFQGLAVVRF
ncbi:nucleoside-binding protein [Hansschlegelia quercus]|uniref:Nucleoside-binding protein n=2 Tax=Hansschlegelia quercus TaxID=2528245 RepID=A0A4Q9GLT6_9HYPH|nr:nucleoside-binding protein [Hansschlegelia quercus]